MTDLFKAIEDGRQHPDSYWGSITDLQDQGWIAAFVKHRDSDHLENSNFDTILKEFSEKFELNEDYRVEGSSHWAVGWLDTMMVRAIECSCEDWEQADITAHPDLERSGMKLWRCHTCATDFGIDKIRNVFYRALEFKDKMDDYPVLDEDDFSRREYEELMEYLEQEVSAAIRHLDADDKIADDWGPNNEQIFEYLFNVHSVCTVDDLDHKWIEEAVLAVAEKEGKKL